MQGMTPSSLWLRPDIWLMLALSLSSVAAFSQTERNPINNARLDDSAVAARVIVKFKQDSALLRKHVLSATASAGETLDTVTARANSLGARLGVSLRAGRALNQHAQVVSASGISSAALAARLAAEADVEYAVVDQRRTHFAVPNDPLYTQGPPVSGSTGGPAAGQWYLRAPTSEVAASINATGAWDITIGSSNIVVAVLDTGVRPEHPDLADRLLAGYDMVGDVPTANDGNGREADASDPGDWVTASESHNSSGPFYQCSVEDSSWHGTMTASLIGAATNNGIGMAGVAGGIKLLPVRVLGKCGGYDSDIIAGMQWAAGLPVPGVPVNPAPARVINMSLGGSGACPQSYLDAINAIVGKLNPAVIVAAAGNSSGHAVSAPANCAGVIGVTGLRHIGTKVGFSDLGPEISISAPGGNCVNTTSGAPCLYPILTATNTGITTPASSSYTDSFNASLGTSFSAPLVAGTAALILSVQPSLTPAGVKAVLQSAARVFPSSGSSTTTPICHAPNGTDQLECYCTTSTCGAGMLDAASAVAIAMHSQNYSDSWWNASESGWGITITDHDTSAFVQWYTYDQTGHNQKYVIADGAFSNGKCLLSGTIQHVTGPGWTLPAFDPNQVSRTNAGSGSIDFCPSGLAAGTIVFNYNNVDGVTGSKQLTRLPFGDDVPHWEGTANTGAADFTDLWWNPFESGWGVSVTQHGNNIFFRVFVYDTDGRPLLFVVPGVTYNSATSFTGDVILTSGPWFGSNPFDPNQVVRTATPGNTATLTFSDANNGVLSYTVNGVTVTKLITRLTF